MDDGQFCPKRERPDARLRPSGLSLLPFVLPLHPQYQSTPLFHLTLFLSLFLALIPTLELG